MDKYFEDKVAVVTGAAGTICSEVAKDLASLGMTVVLVGRTIEKLQKVEEEINAKGGKATAMACDVTDKASTEELAAKVIEKFGKCDYLVNGAGGNNSKAVPKIVAFDPRELEEDRPEDIVGLYNVDMEAFEKVILTNTMGSVYPMLAFAKYMAKQGSGSIHNEGRDTAFLI